MIGNSLGLAAAGPLSSSYAPAKGSKVKVFWAPLLWGNIQAN